MLIFDGDRAGSARVAAWAAGRFRVPLTALAVQDVPDLDELGLTAGDVAGTAVWVDIFGHVDRGSRAIGRALTFASGAWVLVGWLLLVRPTAWLGALAWPIALGWADRRPAVPAAS